MKNREVYLKEPTTRKLVNEGVANVNYEQSSKDLEVLRYELETFVCDGQYEKGLQHILETYMKNIEQAQQPAVWISGFYGSGKSHLAKMLRALWINTSFLDGATARGIADLPQNIQDLLQELNTHGKRKGGLHAASGTLGAAATGSVRLALLSIIFKSVGLPEQYPHARFMMWLKKEGIYEQVKNEVEQIGYDWQEELDNFYVAEGLHQALIKVKPHLFSSPEVCVELLNNQYPLVKDISSYDMIKVIHQALSSEGNFPLTLVVLDEVQQYIGQDGQRATEVQEVVEACCKGIGSKLLFIGTGQTAITGTHNLKKLEGRFTVRIELSDTDVETVIRKVILAKKPEAIPEIEKVYQKNQGEISRHLNNTSIGHRQDDAQYFAQDYPLLPIRRRFWENTLRVLDPTGTESQLRNQLSMVHKVIQTNLDESLGHVVPADYLFFDSAERLLQSRILPRTVYEKTMHWINGTEDEQLTARACGLVFLINKLADKNKEIGIKATVDNIADLLVEVLPHGSASLRGKLPGLLDPKKCDLLMKVGDEYRIQTKESAAWHDEFFNQRSNFSNQAHSIEAERDTRIRDKSQQLIKKLSLTQGEHSRVPREAHSFFNAQLPLDSDKKVYLWVRDGWSTDENSVRADAMQARSNSPTVFIFIPRRSADDLRHHLIEFKAASATLEKRGVPNSPEGTEARSAMETTKQAAENKINELLDEAFNDMKVYQGGGHEIVGGSLIEAIREAAQNAILRLYYKFDIADQSGWDKVYEQAKKGSPDALNKIGHQGEPNKHPVCKEILGYIGNSKKGSDIRNHFEGPPYGWSRDAVDGALQVLLLAGQVRALDERNQPVEPTELERKAIGKTTFKVESTTVTVKQRIEIRKVMQKINCPVKQGEESNAVQVFLQKMHELAERAGGEAPKPQKPDIAALEDIKHSTGNDQLIALYNRRDELIQNITKWVERAENIEKRWPVWQNLQKLLYHAGSLKSAEDIKNNSHSIEQKRLLLTDPDPVTPLVKSLEDELRKELNRLHKKYQDQLNRLFLELQDETSWQKLNDNDRQEILQQCGINPQEIHSSMDIGTLEKLLQVLQNHPLHVWQDRISALPAHFAQAREMAAQKLEPRAQTLTVPRRTLETDSDIEQWVKEVEDQLKSALQNGPVIIK